MWLPLTLLVLAGIVSADFDHGWKVGTEYTYLVRSRTLAGFSDRTEKQTGILMKALLRIQVKDPQTLVARVTKGQYAHVHMSMPQGWDSHISDQMLELLDLPIRGTPFEIKLKHGVIRDMIVERDLPTWEVNILKSIVSQLQVDSQGENVIKTKEMQVPTDAEPYGSFKVMEDSVSGKCEVLYDTAPLSSHVLQMKPELVPKPALKGNGQHIEITKTKNFDRCDQRVSYHFGLADNPHWQGDNNGKLFSMFSTSRVVITGDFKSFTIQSSSTTSKMHATLKMDSEQKGVVVSRMNLTLADMSKISTPLPPLNNPESTGNLVYIYDNPFSSMEERRIGKNIEKSNALVSDSVSSVSSSEEGKNKLKENLRGLSVSSSASSSSISSSEENRQDFWQVKPILQEAPRIPFLSEFIGLKGKVIGKSIKTTLVDLMTDIGYEIEILDTMMENHVLERIETVCGLLRTFNKDEIFEIDNALSEYRDGPKTGHGALVVKGNIWYVFRDAVCQTGTGPAFLLIKSWIEKERIREAEAADILSRLPKTVRVPTAEYIRAFFELAKSPKVINSPLLNSVSVVAFGELLHNSQVNNKTVHNRYPVHTFGRLVSKHDRSLTDEYIPFLAEGLKDASEKRDSAKIQSYIVALGRIGHPKILSVFEPYLEGKRPLTTFQKTLIVASLDNLIDINPKLARSILYKIYLNTMESHEVRCTAVYLLMKTNPPLSMLQRMAEFTNYDTNKHVNSAVKSTLQDLSKMDSPEWQEVAKKAAIAVKQLTTRDFGYQYSHGSITDYAGSKFSIQNIIDYIGSDDSIIPRAIYLGTYASILDFEMSPGEVLVMISNVKSLMNLLSTTQDKNEQYTVKLETEKLAEALNIIPEESVPIEGNLMFNTIFGSKFLPFDENVINKLTRMLMETFMSLKQETYMNEQKFASFDMTIGLPTETGLPFVYDFKMPILYRVNGKVQGEMTPGMMINGKTDVDTTFLVMAQGRVGFITPFEHKHYIAGAETSLTVHVPLKVDVNVNTMKRNLQLKWWPRLGHSKGLLQLDTIPYTAAHDILELKPLKLEATTQDVRLDSETCREKRHAQMLPMSAATLVWRTLNTFGMDMSRPKVNIGQPIDLQKPLNSKKEEQEPLILTVSYDTLSMEADPDVARQWNPMTVAVEPTSKDADSSERRKQMLKEAAKGIKLAKSRVVDIQLAVNNPDKMSTILTFAWSDSDVENKGRLLSYWRIGSKSSGMEICLASQATLTPDNLLFNDEPNKVKAKGEFDVDIRYGETTCSAGEQINVKGKVMQSKKLEKRIKETPLAITCNQQLQQGNKILRACQNVVARSLLFNELDVTIDSPSEEVQETISQVLQNIVSLFNVDEDVNVANPKNAGKKKIDIRGKLSEDLKSATFHIHTPIMDIRVLNADISEMEILPDNVLGSTDDQADLADLIYSDERSSCMLDKTRVETFDGETYPLRLGNCWHVAMTTYPKLNPKKPGEKLRLPISQSVSVLTRETDDGHKEVKILLGEDQIILLPKTPLPQVIVNGETIEVTENRSYQKKKEDDVMFEIYKFGEKAIGLSSDEFDIRLIFDGKRIMIQATDDYRNSIRGLCGNFDGENVNDFTGPESCILKTSEKFIASYALTKEQCQGQSLEIAKTISKHADCIPLEKTRHSNVINDVESGRSDLELEKWGYHSESKVVGRSCLKPKTEIQEIDNKVCFSKRPVMYCDINCTPTETKSKNYEFHCMNWNNHSREMKRRVQNGAIPDLSQKHTDFTRSFDVPLACTA